VQGSQVAVGPDGTVYVVWIYSAGNGQAEQFIATSADSPTPFSQPHAISPLFNLLAMWAPYRRNSFPALAVNPQDGDVYVAYADSPSATSSIEFIASSDHGANFTSWGPLDDDNGTGQRFMPAVAVDANSRTVHCSWFDTRNSPDQTALYYDIYATYGEGSAAGGFTFAPNARVTAHTIRVEASLGFLGDYSGIAAAGGFAHPVWTISDTYYVGSLQTARLSTSGTVDPGFALSASSFRLAAPDSTTATSTVWINRVGGFSDALTWSVSGGPSADVGLTLVPQPGTEPEQYALTLSGLNGASAGAYPLLIKFQDSVSGKVHSFPVTLDLASMGAVSIDFSPSTTKQLNFILTVKDSLGNPVGGATLFDDIYLNGSLYASGYGTTASDGTIGVHLAGHTPAGTYTALVWLIENGADPVNGETLTWDATTPLNNSHVMGQ
jgi:hypothetical protein